MDTTTVVLLVLIGIGVLMIVGVLLPIFLYQSLYMIKTNEKIVFYRFGDYSYIVLSKTYWKQEWQNSPGNKSKVPDHNTVRMGSWKGGWAFGAWPIYLGYRVPTDQFEIPIHSSQMYTDESHPEYPRVRVEGDATLQFRLSDNPIHLGLVFSMFKQDPIYYVSKAERDLTNHDVIIQENGGQGRRLSVKKIALRFYNVVNKPMQEAMRTAATGFTFSVSPGAAGTRPPVDITKERREFEKAVQHVLTEDDDTIFMQGKLLKKTSTLTASPAVTIEAGDSLIVCNIVVENIQLQPGTEKDAEAQRAIDYSFIGRQEGLRKQAVEKLSRIGKAEGIEVLATKLGLTTEPQKAFLMDVIQNKEGALNLTTVNIKDAADVLSAIESFLKKQGP